MNDNLHMTVFGIVTALSFLILRLSELLDLIYFLPLFSISIGVAFPTLVKILFDRANPATQSKHLMIEAKRITALSIEGREDEFTPMDLAQMDQNNFIQLSKGQQ